MKFKTPRQEDEFIRAKAKIKEIVLSAASYMMDKYKYEIVVTEVFRSQAEQDDIYKNDPNYKIKPWRSVHQDGRGVDLRTNDMTKAMIDDLRDYLNTIPYDPKRPEKKTCLVHEVDNHGNHFHIQTL